MAQKSEIRAHREELQRVQIGLVGLAAVLLVVTLANLVIDSAKVDESGLATTFDGEPGAVESAGANASGSKPSGNEPLADLGVTPTAESAAPTLPSPVPDLEPDPRLRERMDQDPDPAPPAQ
jgi:hypothetical protein